MQTVANEDLDRSALRRTANSHAVCHNAITVFVSRIDLYDVLGTPIARRSDDEVELL